MPIVTNHTAKKSRLTEWWKPKAGTIFSLLLFYLALWNVPFQVGVQLLFYSIITLTGFGLIGYFLNDWADIPSDRKAGKTNLVDGIPTFWRWVIFTGLLAVTLVPWFLYFKVDNWSVGLIAAQFVLLAAYPLPPVRLKNYPKVAILTDSLYAFAIPAVLAWHTMDLTADLNLNQGQKTHFIVLFLWMLALGVRQMINHHVTDRRNDARTGTPNLALKIRPVGLRKFIQTVVFPTELIGGLLFFIVLIDGMDPFLWAVPATIAILGLRHLQRSFRGFSVPFAKTAFDRFNSFHLGLFCCVLLIAEQWQYSVVALIFLILFSDLFRHPLVPFMRRRLWNGLIAMARFPYSTISLGFNWSLYYFRKWFLRWSEEKNWGEHYTEHLEDLELAARKKKGIVAVFNHNYNKYTETFVAGHLKELPFHVIPFYGWPAPVHTVDMENLLSDERYVQGAVYSKAQLLDTDPRQQENDVIAKRLIAENVDVILAEFGTMAARLVVVSESTGIPMVPIFYGYDAWHSQVLTEHGDDYKRVFVNAPLVIGVSQDICRQLVLLGCPKEKVEYLPCHVDLQRFQFVERTFSEPDFLSVGRFCSTKAPFLTIMAYRIVVDEIPNAQLRMIGGDDNGVLETCLSLIKALKLTDNIDLIGTATPAEVLKYMSQASIFVQHSVTTPQNGDKEGTPVAIMEAMATGLPIIATEHAGISEMIESNVTGILVAEFDHADMAREMIALIKDPEKMRKMGKRASEAIHSDPLIKDHIGLLSKKLETQIIR